ncbi:efflux RND transporter permease subunit [Vibrio lentus]|nr:efflux RND transporter permease subunit [Vibrio lentus]
MTLTVVVENIFHHIERGESPLLAAYKGTREVGFAVTATTLVLVMVFLPISFMDGMVGLLFTEFSVLLAMSVIFVCCGINANASSAVRSLKVNVKTKPLQSICRTCVWQARSRIQSGIAPCVKLALGCSNHHIACMGGSYGLMQQVPSQLTPQEDRGVIFVCSWC